VEDAVSYAWRMRGALAVLTVSLLSGTVWAERPKVSIWAPGDTPPEVVVGVQRPPAGTTAVALAMPYRPGRRVVYVAPLERGSAHFAVVIPTGLVFPTVTLLDGTGNALSEPYPEVLLHSACARWGSYIYGPEDGPGAVAPATWQGEAAADSLHVLETGIAFARYRLHVTPDDWPAILHTRVRDLLGNELQECFDRLERYSSLQDIMQIFPTARDWPDRVIVEMTLLDQTGHSSDTRTVETSVVRHTIPYQDPPQSFWERFLVFGALPFLVGILGGSVLGRRRFRAR